MAKRQLPDAFLTRAKAVASKRPRTVIQHILKHGFVTTEELESKYGYKHPPRTARDVREEGIPLETFRVKNADGRSIAAYRFADPSKIRKDRLGGRKVFSKEFKESLVRKTECRCSICLEEFEDRYLQVDHCVPYEVSGDVDDGERNVEDYMLLCGSCNRAKSWSCEHCANSLQEKSAEICRSCYWASPGSYKHIALRLIRRMDIVWTEQELEAYERLRKRAEASKQSMPDYVKVVLARHVTDVE